MAKAESAKTDFERWMYRSWAYGVFSYWDRLTMGWQQIGDSERLEALTNPEQKETAYHREDAQDAQGRQG